MKDKCNICECHAPKTTRAIVGGKYYRSVCRQCLLKQTKLPHDAAFNRERGREDNAKEILQPFKPDGTVNEDFAYAYPKQAADILGKENIKEL